MNVKQLSIILTACFIIGSINLSAQDVMTDKYSPEQLKEDLSYFLKTAEDLHPNLYHSVSRESITAYKKELEDQIQDSMTAVEFARLVIPLSTKFVDGHTSLWFPYFDVNKAYLKANRFPLGVEIMDRQLFVVKNYSSDPSIEIWDEILSINGQSSKDLIGELLTYKNGEIEHFRLASLQRSFSYYLWLFKSSGDNFTIRIKRGEEYFDKQISGISAEEMKSKTVNNPTPPDYSFSFVEENVGLIDFRSMVNPGLFNKFLDSTFQVLHDRGTEHLIIDIRNNGGGNSRLGESLINYLTDKPYKQSEMVTIKTSRTAKDHYKKNIIKWYMYPLYPAILFNKQARASIAKKDGSITEIYASETKPKRNKKNRFKGKVYLLIGPNTFSSANMLAAAFSCYNIGSIIGQPTGQPDVSYGDMIYIILPNSKNYAWSSTKLFCMPCTDKNNPNASTDPDYTVIQTIEDKISERDAVLEFTINKINKDENETLSKN